MQQQHMVEYMVEKGVQNLCTKLVYLPVHLRYHGLLTQYKTKKRTVKGLYPLQCDIYRKFCRREWDLNPRMSVLQTDALGHLAIPPKLACGAKYTAASAPRQAKIEFFLSFFASRQF